MSDEQLSTNRSPSLSQRPEASDQPSGSEPGLGLDKFIVEAASVIGDYIDGPDVIIDLHRRLMRKAQGGAFHLGVPTDVLVSVITSLENEYLGSQNRGSGYDQYSHEIIYWLARGTSDLAVHQHAMRIFDQEFLWEPDNRALYMGIIGRHSPHAQIQIDGLQAIADDIRRLQRLGHDSSHREQMLYASAPMATHPESQLVALDILTTFNSEPINTVAEMLFNKGPNGLDEAVVLRGVHILGAALTSPRILDMGHRGIVASHIYTIAGVTNSELVRNATASYMPLVDQILRGDP